MLSRLGRPLAGILGGVLLITALLPASAAASGVATQLVFVVQPTNVAAGTAISPSVVLQVEDTYGHVVTSDSSTVTVALGANASYGVVGGTTSVQAVNGVATFGNLSVNNPGTYTLVATDATDNLLGVSTSFTVSGSGTGALYITSASSTTFTVGAASTFVIRTTGTTGTTISETGTLPGGIVFTNYGNGTATLSGTPSAIGVYSLTFTATSGTLTPATQGFTLTIQAGATNLTFVTQPGGGQPNLPWAQQPVVSVRDNYGNLVTTPVAVTLTMGTNPGGGLLYCPTSGTTVTTTNGYAYFSGCYITAAGTGYTLVASASGLTSVTSSAFNIGTGLTSVTLTDSIAPGVNRGTSGFGIKSLVVPANSYVTVLVQTSPNLAGSLLQIWVESKTVGWHSLTLRQVASDGTVHYFAKVNGWTGYWVKFVGNSTYAASTSHGRIATNPD